MNLAELTLALEKTLADHRISRSEKQSLRELIGNAADDKHLASVIRSNIFQIARSELQSAESKQIVEWLEDVLKLLIPREQASSPKRLQSEAFFSSQDHCSEKIIRIIGRLRHSIEICVFTITNDRISDAIIEAHRRGVKVRIVTDDEKSRDRGSDIERLQLASIPLRMDASPDHMHHKYALFDGAYLLTGSYNWTRSADTRNKENFIITNDPDLVDEFKNHFEGIWRGYE